VSRPDIESLAATLDALAQENPNPYAIWMGIVPALETETDRVILRCVIESRWGSIDDAARRVVAGSTGQ
jgi:hypothetical protein